MEHYLLLSQPQQGDGTEDWKMVQFDKRAITENDRCHCDVGYQFWSLLRRAFIFVGLFQFVFQSGEVWVSTIFKFTLSLKGFFVKLFSVKCLL